MKKNAEKCIVVFGEVQAELDAARMARIIVDAAQVRKLSFAPVTVSKAGPSFSEPELNGTGVESEPLTDAGER